MSSTGPNAASWRLATAVGIGGLLVALFGAVSARAASQHEMNTDRPGSDYKVEIVRRIAPGMDGIPDFCEALCLAEHGKCRAWTYVKAGVQHKSPLCYLKNDIPKPVPNVCCISGVLPSKSRSAVAEEPGDVAIQPDAPARAPAPPSSLGAVQPSGAIGDKYAKLGGANGAMGHPAASETDAPHGGRCQAFQNGTVCWHPDIGEAFGVWGLIYAKWTQVGRVEFGYPITDERPTPDGRGRFNHFRSIQYPGRPEASIYWTPHTGAHAIYGAIRDAWAQQGWERGPLGYPTSDEHQDGKYRRVNFERGFIRWAPDTGIEVGR